MINIIKTKKNIKMMKIQKFDNNELHVLPLWGSVINLQDSLSLYVHIHNSISSLGWN